MSGTIPENWYERFKSKRLYCKNLYLDTMNITSESMDKFVHEWKRRDADILFGHAHSLYILAKYLKSKNDHGLYPR